MRNQSTQKPVELVVARYNEDLQWLRPFEEFSTVYNKGKHQQQIKDIALPNQGREGHTYLHHIITNYEHLAERTIFCQGDPFEHSPDIIPLIDCWQQHRPVQPLNWRWIEHDSKKAKAKTIKGKVARLFHLQRHQFGTPPLSIRLNNQADYFLGNRIFVDALGPDLMTIYPLDMAYWSRSRKNTIPLVAQHGNNALAALWQQLGFEEPVPGYIYSNFAAQFSASREAIRMRPKEFYEGLVEYLLSDKNEQQKHGILLERLWLAIMNYQSLNKIGALPKPNYLETSRS